MASIDDAIKTLIKELQKVRGETATGGRAAPERVEGEEGARAEAFKKINELTDELNEKYDQLLSKDSERLKNQKKYIGELEKELAKERAKAQIDEQKIMDLI